MATVKNTTSATVIAGAANNRRCMRSTHKAEICFSRKRRSGPAPHGPVLLGSSAKRWLSCQKELWYGRTLGGGD